MAPSARIPSDAKNPSQYSVDEVINFFWPNGEAPSWASGLPPPDPALLGPAFRANDITGNVLLHSVTNEVLRNDLGVINFAQRAYMVIGISMLRVRSAAFPSPAAPEQSSRTEPAGTIIASTPLGSVQSTVPRLRAQSEPLHAIIPNTPTAGTTLPATTKKQPRRVTSIITTPLVPKPAAPVAPAANPSSASRSSLPPTDDDGKPFHPGWERFKANIVKNNPANTANNEDDVLPPYGESEYNTEDEMEIEALPKKPKKEDIPTEPAPPVDLTEFNSIVDNLILEKRLEWINGISRDMWEASGLCEQGRDDTAIRDGALNDIAKFEKRLSDLRDAIYGHRYTSNLLIVKACESLDETLSELFFREWQLAELDRPEPSPKQIQQDGSEPHGTTTFATSGPPGPSDPSSSSDGYDSEEPEEPSGAEGPSDACNSEDNDIRPSDEPAAKKPRLESDIIDRSLPETSLMSGLLTGSTRVVIDLTGDSPEPEENVPILPRVRKHVLWLADKKLKAKERKAAKRESCDDTQNRERGTAEAINLGRLRIPRSAAPSVQPMPPSLPMGPRPLASKPPVSPSVRPRSISPMSEEGMAMYQ